MKKIIISIIFFTAFYSVVLCQQSRAVNGIWLGTLKVQSLELRIGITFSVSETGNMKAVMTSIDQGGVEVPMEEASLSNDTLRIIHSGAGIIIEGIFNPGSASWETDFSQGPFRQTLIFSKVEELPEIVKPQEPKPPYPYQAEEVTFENRAAGITIAGTLTIPAGEGPFTAVILLTGSGPQNRDEELFGHKPFKVLADYLTREGIAVLRCDDRGIGGTTGSFPGSTTGDFAEDALAGLDFLKTRSEIDPLRIGLAGHSEGGMMATIAASRTAEVGFIVLMAAPALPFDQVILFQKERIWEKAGMREADMDLNRTWHNQVFDLAAGDLSNTEIRDEMITMSSGLSEDEKNRLYQTEENLEAEIVLLTNPWWRYASKYDAVSTLKMISCPVLAINGSKDTQVTAGENLAVIEETLNSSGNANNVVRELEGLNHLFQTANSGDESEYQTIEETFSPDAMKVIADWIGELVIL